MTSIRAVVFSVLIGGAVCSIQNLTFPPGFKFGAASSSYQVEGAWNVTDKSESIWDRFTHAYPEKIQDGSNGDVACDSYHQWRRDIEIASELGLHFYRFSISWVRLLPTGFNNYISEDGKRYYNNLIDGLLSKHIEPLVTIYHWELPQRLQDLGGWTNPHITEWYAEYAKIVFTLFGDRVKTWITINEPQVFCEATYNTGAFAPGIIDPEIGANLCIKHALIAHAKAWRMYDKEFRHKYHGELSLANHLFWFEPYSKEAVELTELVQEYANGRYSHPVYSKEGGWPVNITKAMALNSKRQGYSKSTLPILTKHEIEFIKGTYDFYAFNYYASKAVRKARKGEELLPSPTGDTPELNAKLLARREWPKTAIPWFVVNPPGIRKQLNWLRQKYGDLKFFITENGYSSLDDGLNDVTRIHYYRDHLEQVLLAINEDGINVAGYTAWTLMDNFEWPSAYQTKFGLYAVDFTSPERTRRPRASAHYYRSVIKTHSLNVPIPKIGAVIAGTHRVIPSLLVLCNIIVAIQLL